MSLKKYPMGSPEWADEVFESPPVRKLKGHSRHTQYHKIYSEQLQCYIGVQGRNECCAALSILYLIRLGVLRRAKPQPFKTDKDEFGAEIVPDFLVETQGNTPNLFTIEQKSARFLTRAKSVELDDYRERFARFNVKYVVWTDERPVSHSVRHNLINMRAGAQRYAGSPEIDKLASWAKSHNRSTLEQFYATDFDLDCLYAASWLGKVFFPITRPLQPETVLTTYPQEDYGALYLGCDNRVDEWWQALPLAS